MSTGTCCRAACCSMRWNQICRAADLAAVPRASQKNCLVVALAAVPRALAGASVLAFASSQAVAQQSAGAKRSRRRGLSKGRRCLHFLSRELWPWLRDWLCSSWCIVLVGLSWSGPHYVFALHIGWTGGTWDLLLPSTLSSSNILPPPRYSS